MVLPFLAGALGASVLIGLAVLAVRALGAPPVGMTRVAQATMIGIGLAGALARALPLQRAPQEDFPVVDGVTLGFLAAIPLAFFLPRLRSLEAFGVKLTTSDLAAVQDTLDTYDGTVRRGAALLDEWTSTLGTLVERLAECGDIATARILVDTFLRDRLGEARQWIAGRETGEPRIALWLHEADADRLVFFFSNEIADEETTHASFARGEGMAGQAFEERRTLNEPKATRLPSFKPIRANPPSYSAILATPISLGANDVGVLTVDKPDETAFSAESESLARAAASLSSLALYAYFERADALAGRAAPR